MTQKPRDVDAAISYLHAAQNLLAQADGQIDNALAELAGNGNGTPHYGLTDLGIYPKPTLTSFGAAGTSIVDPVFGTPILRVTDAYSRPDAAWISFRTPASTATRTWAADGKAFGVTTTDGAAWVFDWNGQVQPGQKVPRLLNSVRDLPERVPAMYSAIEWSPTDPNRAYGPYGAAPNHYTIGAYDHAHNQTTSWLDLGTIVPELKNRGDTYLGGMYCGGGRLVTACGGYGQDQHDFFVAVTEPDAKLVLKFNTMERFGFHLHSVQIDATGRYAMMTPASGDHPPHKDYVVDIDTNTVTPLTVAVSGHTDTGYGCLCNQDCPPGSEWDAYQWVWRDLARPNDTVRGLIAQVLRPKLVYGSDHQNWAHAVADRLRPIISATYRYGAGVTDPSWRAWDDEVLAIPTDGQGGPVRRFCHHRSNPADNFWSTPRPNVSPDGSWCLFTSNWEYTLGEDPYEWVPAGAPRAKRQDVFLIPLSDV